MPIFVPVSDPIGVPVSVPVSALTRVPARDSAVSITVTAPHTVLSSFSRPLGWATLPRHSLIQVTINPPKRCRMQIVDALTPAPKP